MMIKQCLYLVFFCTVLAFPSVLYAQSEHEAASISLNLVFVGDSLTAQKRYPNAVTKKLNDSEHFKEIKSAIEGYGGKTPGQLLAMVNDESIKLSPEKEMINLAIVMAGTNAYHIEDLGKLVDAVVAKGFKVLVVCTPPRRQDEKKKYGVVQTNFQFNQKLMKKYPEAKKGQLRDVQWMNANVLLLDPAKKDAKGAEWLHPEYAKDHTHLNREGYERLGEAVAMIIDMMIYYGLES